MSENNNNNFKVSALPVDQIPGNLADNGVCIVGDSFTISKEPADATIDMFLNLTSGIKPVVVLADPDTSLVEKIKSIRQQSTANDNVNTAKNKPGM